VRFLPAGDTALVVEFGDRIDRRLNDRVLLLAEQVETAGLAGVGELVPTFRSLMLHYDPLATSARALTDAIAPLLGAAERSGGRRRLLHMQACYDPRCAPDLAEVAERTGLSPDEVVGRHAATEYHVYMIGFLLGSPYLGDLPAELELPRRTEPRVRVPAGAIAIALRMSCIYPVESPGGWHLIGATPVRLFDADWPQPALLSPGDRVRFSPIDFAEFEQRRAAPPAEPGMLSWEEIAG
jgi:KipI family sensor histidine kinase inhibitor